MTILRYSLLLILLTFSKQFVYATQDDIDQGYNFVLQHLRLWDGWCPEEKAIKMMEIIYEIEPEICVEIGAFGGSSIFPTAYALKSNGKGIVYAIDPWDNEECVLYTDTKDPNYDWWSQVNLEGVYRKFLKMLDRFQLRQHCIVLRANSINAFCMVPDEIDILHIDGDHSEEASYKDAILYFEKVRPGGYIWFDDINWTNIHGKKTTRKALDYLLKRCTIVQEWDEYILLQKTEVLGEHNA